MMRVMRIEIQMVKKCLLGIVIGIFIVSCEDPDIIKGRDNNLALGNPSKAGTAENNYLLEKPQYTVSYNRSKGTANWVSWHLSTAWFGDVTRVDNFRQDDALPAGWYKAKSADYVNSGFDRGHLCPSDDRDGSVADNDATFLMTNIIPQSPNSNREPWANLETYCRKLATTGNEMYIVAGVWGQGGSGSNGGTTKTLADGRITVPEFLWKVILILPVGDDDQNRINSNTRVIAIKIPNRQSIENDWGKYRISVDELEDLTGYDFFSTLSTSLQKQLEGKKDGGGTY